MTFFRRSCIALGLIAFLFSPSVLSKVPNRLEPTYVEAILAFNEKKYDRSIQLLDRLIKRAPRTIEFLELKALALKLQKKSTASAKVYQKLIRSQKKKGVNTQDLAPYYLSLIHI